jgi:hypothetical protein
MLLSAIEGVFVCSLYVTFAPLSCFRRNIVVDREFVGGALLDSLKFSKQDAKYAPAPVSSAALAKSMLAKVSTPPSLSLFGHSYCGYSRHRAA